MSASELAEERVNLTYEGSYLRTMLWFLITGIVSVLIIPAAWATAFLYRRILPQISFSDGTRAAFQGLAGTVWGWFVFAGVISLTPTVIGGLVYNGDPFSLFLNFDILETARETGDSTLLTAYQNANAAQSVATFVVLPITLYAQLVIIRWAIAGMALIEGPDLYFAGRYLRLLGWVLLFIISGITIIGWAWVATAYLRWFARNIEGAGIRFEFHGSGWGVLWRGLGIGVVTAALALMILLSPVFVILVVIWYLWALVWLFRWLIRNVVMVRSVSSPSFAATDM